MLNAKFKIRKGLRSSVVVKMEGLADFKTLRAGAALGRAAKAEIGANDGKTQHYSALFRIIQGKRGNGSGSLFKNYAQKIKVDQGCSSWLKVDQGILKHFFMTKLKGSASSRQLRLVKPSLLAKLQ